MGVRKAKSADQNYKYSWLKRLVLTCTEINSTERSFFCECNQGRIRKSKLGTLPVCFSVILNFIWQKFEDRKHTFGAKLIFPPNWIFGFR